MLELRIKKVACILAAIGSLSALMACGESPSRPISLETKSNQPNGIIGGKEATDEDFVKTVAMIYDKVTLQVCTASIYSNEILITAAHCITGPPERLGVIFGVNFQSSTKVLRNVKNYRVSPTWLFRLSEWDEQGDVALVTFEGDLPEGFRPAPLLREATELKNGAKVRVAGYGISDAATSVGAGYLRYIDTTILNLSFSESEALIDQSHGKGACHGDSGGPAYVMQDKTWVLWGITNRGINDSNGKCRGQTVFATIPYWRAWIEQTAQRLVTAPAPASSPSPASDTAE